MDKIKLVIGSDHGGFKLKKHLIEYLESLGYSVEDFGTYSNERCDYPNIAFKVAASVRDKLFDKGILICTTGQGIAIAANKVKGIRACCCSDLLSARMSVSHNNANILTLGEKIVSPELARQIVNVWLEAKFEGGRHLQRLHQIEEFENSQD